MSRQETVASPAAKGNGDTDQAAAAATGGRLIYANDEGAEAASDSSPEMVSSPENAIALKAATEYHNIAVSKWRSALRAKEELVAALRRTSAAVEEAAAEKDEASRYLERLQRRNAAAAAAAAADGANNGSDDGITVVSPPPSPSLPEGARAATAAPSSPALQTTTRRMRIGGSLPGWYAGGLNDRNQRHGRGIMQYDDGRVYVGDFVNNKMHGQGRCTWPDGAVFEGEFVNGLPSSPEQRPPSVAPAQAAPASSSAGTVRGRSEPTSSNDNGGPSDLLSQAVRTPKRTRVEVAGVGPYASTASQPAPPSGSVANGNSNGLMLLGNLVNNNTLQGRPLTPPPQGPPLAGRQPAASNNDSDQSSSTTTPRPDKAKPADP